MASEISNRLLGVIHERGHADTISLSREWGLNHQAIIGGLKSCEAVGALSSQEKQVQVCQLTDEGKHIAEHGSHEALLYAALTAEGVPQSRLMQVSYLSLSTLDQTDL